MLETATCRLIMARENWLICGPIGVGTRRSDGAQSALLSDPSAALRPLRRASRWNGLQNVTGVDLLILDDFGLRPISAQGADDLYEIIHRRYERGSILVTSNRAPSEWGELFGDQLLSSVVLDRLTHFAWITTVTGASYRQRQRRKETPTAPGNPLRKQP